MLRGIVSGIMLTILLASMLTLAIKIQTIRADLGTIYISMDGSIVPPTAPISSTDTITYTLTDNIRGDVCIVIERTKTYDSC